MKLSEIEKDILLETVKYYNLSNRGYNDERKVCEYLTESGNKCALGRCILEEAIDQKAWDFKTVTNLWDLYDGIDGILKDEYKGCSFEFWDKIQMLHDVEGNWTEEGISEKGKNSVLFMFGVSL